MTRNSIFNVDEKAISSIEASYRGGLLTWRLNSLLITPIRRRYSKIECTTRITFYRRPLQKEITLSSDYWVIGLGSVNWGLPLASQQTLIMSIKNIYRHPQYHNQIVRVIFKRWLRVTLSEEFRLLTRPNVYHSS